MTLKQAPQFAWPTDGQQRDNNRQGKRTALPLSPVGGHTAANLPLDLSVPMQTARLTEGTLHLLQRKLALRDSLHHHL